MSEHATPSLADLPLFDDAPASSTPAGSTLAGAAAPMRTAGPSHSPAATLARGGRAASATSLPTTLDLAATPAPAGWAGASGVQLDWALVRAFRQLAAEQLTASLRDRENLDDAAQHELGRNIILELLSSHADTAMTSGAATFTADEQQALAGAVYDALFGLGRLQPLVDDPDVENIEIRGHDNVHLIYGDGRITKGPPVADSNEELIDFVSFLAARSERAFSRSHSRLNLRLPGGQRLAASGWNTPWPLIVIRAHRLVEVDLEDLVDRDVMNTDLAAFLRAAVRARKTIVISGAQGSGKTTVVRALCNEIDPAESIGTIETEFELHLHEMGDRHPRISPWEGRPGVGERGPDGRAAGEITLDAILEDSLRYNLGRIIVGEARGREVGAMFKAMQTAAGSLCTTHAYNARGAIERLVGLAMEAPHITSDVAYRQAAMHIDLVVQIADVSVGGRRSRFISEVLAVELGERGMPAFTPVYWPGPDGRAVPGTPPPWLDDLVRAGYNPAAFTGRAA